MSATLESLAQRFRRCPVTGLQVNRDSELLIQANAVVAVVAMLVGALAAIGLVLTRWQAVHLLPADQYYRYLTAHGLNMLIFWVIFFEMAVLYFAGPVVLGCRQPAPTLAWGAFALMVVGAGMVDWMVFTGNADVLFTSYPPLRAHPNYYLGVILFAVGALIAVSLFFASLVVAKKEKTYSGSVPLVTFGATTAAIIAVITLLHGAAVYIPTWLWSMDIGNIDPEVYRMVWWGLGHSSQQINVAAMVSVWYLLGGLTVGGVVLNEKVSRMAFVLYVLFISMASAHHLLVDPGMGSAWKIWNTSYAMYLAVLASMVHGFTVPAGIETGQRLRGYTNGLFEWLRKAPWSDPGFSGMWLSLVIFGFMGGITGVTLGTEQINIMAHNTLRVPGHFHTTVVGGTTLAFMAVTYYVLPLIFRKRVAFWGMARLQPFVFGGGIVAMALGMIFMGILGMPRRHWDSSFAGSPFPVELPPASELVQVLFGVGGLLAAVGALMFIAIAVVTVFFGKPVTEEAIKAGASGIPQGVLKLPAQVHTGEVAERQHREGVKGTVVLVAIFFVCFIVYYFTNWKMLSFLWKVG
ncbi:MAG: cbb3-type cytochrome c oxidase subunit I [Candidatus Eisenbacteria bacterium]|uniref:Cbb3-type cytochrome c oxidase subunit I n=1 Tax=Eiseniibacteriota bacterium TaxID=2212470 RepID=A0A933SE00_UNCEI|nr:cbb3-type cytochrome c oxidase subunit I [Candidatus Eisenbacteria bacterium]